MIKALSLLLVLPVAVAQAEQKVGTVAIYTDGQVEKLVEIGDGWTLWEDQRKRLYKKSNLPFIPLLGYQKFPDRSQGYTQSVMYGAPEKLKPYGELDSVKFDLFKQSNNSSTKRFWQCSYEGKGRFKLDKKKYKTYNYRCDRITYQKFVYPKLRQFVELKYSPTLQLVVDEKWWDKNEGEERIKLHSLISPEKATAKRISRVVYKLRTSK